MPVLAHLGPAAPSGVTRYESEIFGSEYRDNLFAALFNLHKVTRHILKPTGASYQTTDSDFLVSDNTDFHPTDIIEDADGSLLVVDTGGWYKLCCPTSQLWKPDVLGAIYRQAGRREGACSNWIEAENLLAELAAREALSNYVGYLRPGLQANIARCRAGAPVSEFEVLAEG